MRCPWGHDTTTCTHRNLCIFEESGRGVCVREVRRQCRGHEELFCEFCDSWDADRLAHPGAAPGSLRICAKGHETHSGSWKPCWTPKSEARLIEEAHSEGRLF